MVPFTGFALVTPRTRLSGLNLDWRERDLPEKLRTKHVHRLHPYLGKFVPQLVEIFLRKYRPAAVGDPFCGSGTTLVEAAALGIDAAGCDISEFNCLLGRVKTAVYDIPELEREARWVVERLKLPEGRSDHPAPSAYLRAWLAPRALRQLLRYRDVVWPLKHADFFKVVLSRAARSARLTRHFDLDFPQKPQRAPYHCFKHDRVCRPVQDAEAFVRRYLADALERARQFAALRRPAQVTVLCGDAREIDFPHVEMVVTSPPYVGLIDYHEQHRYAYELLGLEDRSAREIGPARLHAGAKARAAYVDGIAAVFSRLRERLPKGGRAVIVVNDKHGLYDGLASRLGYRQDEVLRRKVNRRTGLRTSAFDESVLVWRKL